MDKIQANQHKSALKKLKKTTYGLLMKKFI